VEQQSGNQFYDDLTVGTDDGSYSTDSIDLFEFTGDAESPIARLKTIILSIDWEINDDILKQLDDELVDLADIWAGDKIKLVYVQGLNKIGRYIFKEKANAHPNAINLLITFYHNLEKIVASEDSMNEEEKKQLLFKDVKSFDQLKQQIGMSSPSSTSLAKSPAVEITQSDQTDYLKTLKAHVLGLDWEINDEELQKLDDEVNRLQDVFSQSKAKLILLQGIGALSSYINKMRSQSNSKAFTLMHSFYGTLETITESDLPADEQKQLLLSEVEKFNLFKTDIATSKPEPAEVVKESKPAVDFSKPATAVVAGAVASAAFSEVDEEIGADEEEVASDVESRLDAVFGEDEEEAPSFADANSALEGVDVESEADDDSDEEALPYYGDTVAPALSEVEEESSFSVEKLASDLAQPDEEDDQEESPLESDAILQGVDVECEADDDSDEETLPFEDGDLAPALAGSSDDSGFDEDILAEDLEESASEDLENRLDSFFDEEVQTPVEVAVTDQEDAILESESEESDFVAALSEDTDEIETLVAEEFEPDEELSFFDEEPAPALSGSEAPSMDEDTLEDAIEEKLSFFDEEVQTPVEAGVTDQENAILESESDVSDFVAALSEDTNEIETPVAGESEPDDELSFFDEEPAPAFSGSEAPSMDEDTLEDAIEEKLSFFDEEPQIPAVDSTMDQVDDDEAGEDIELDDLSFLDEEVPAPALGDMAESLSPDEQDVAFGEEEQSFFDDEPAPALSEDNELASVDDDIEKEMSLQDEEIDIPILEDNEDFGVEEETIEESIEEELAFFDDDVPESEFDMLDEAVDTVSSDTEELIDTEEIEFTVPGEVGAGTVAGAAVAGIIGHEEAEPEDIIEFMVPGEDELSEIPSDAVEEVEIEEVVFEAVDDDVEVDPLPGEEFADSTSTDFVSDEAPIPSDTTALEPLGDAIASLQEDISENNLQSLFSEINKSRNLNPSNPVGKIFLQLLSTTCQHVERNMDGSDASSLALMDEVYSGFNMSTSPDASTEQMHQLLLTCISKVLLLQQNDINRS